MAWYQVKVDLIFGEKGIVRGALKSAPTSPSGSGASIRRRRRRFWATFRMQAGDLQPSCRRGLFCL